MPKTWPLHFILPLLVPMGLAAVLLNFGAAPTDEKLLADLEHPDPEVREVALEWLAEVRRPSLLEKVHEAVFDPDEDVAEEALEVIDDTESPLSLETLQRAYEERPELRKEVIAVIGDIHFPQVIPILEQYLESPDPEIQEAAREELESMRQSLNHEVVFYSLGKPIFTRLGHVIYSQAVMYPEGREMVEGTSVMLPQEGGAP